MGTTYDRTLVIIRQIPNELSIFEIPGWNPILVCPTPPWGGEYHKIPVFHNPPIRGPSTYSFGRISTKLRSLIAPMMTTNDRSLLIIQPIPTELSIFEILS